ncbi:hypothetical protein AB0D13_40010 [Streptomyces sp. NPDC048430]|uniref:oxidoreductase n=1 Tax=Streptomyces sp. NPDC048430 TaxID=3155388 RepID=UPI00342CD823
MRSGPGAVGAGLPLGQVAVRRPTAREIARPAVRSAVRAAAARVPPSSGATRPVEAGADGVEIHGANGYLLHQFLAPGANQRTDEYGGSPENRARFVVDVVTEVAKAVGPERVGLRISPEIVLSDVFETDRDDVLATYGTLVDQLRPLGLAYLSVLHGEPGGELVQELRQRFDGKLIVNSGFLGGQTTREDAMQRIEADHADAVVVGRALIANPDLVERWQNGHPENEPRPELFYAPGAEGYTDYPFLPANRGSRSRLSILQRPHMDRRTTGDTAPDSSNRRSPSRPARTRAGFTSCLSKVTHAGRASDRAPALYRAISIGPARAYRERIGKSRRPEITARR